MENHPDSRDPDVAVVEKLLFDFRYDDGTTVVDRFVRRSGLSEAERAMASGFLDGVGSFFEVLADAPAGAIVIKVRCCLSDLEHVVAPTEPAGVPTLPRGSFLAGRMNPVAGTDLWTPSGALEVLPASSRVAVADAVMEMALSAAHPDDLDLLRGSLDDPGVPSWLLRRIVADRLPAAEVALAGALSRPDFSWDRDGEHLLASTPGDHEPTVTLAIVPSLCSK